MAIYHNLVSNGYLINNEIWMQISSSQPAVYFKIYFQNFINAKITTNFILYTDLQNTINVNLQPIIKSLFPNPDGELNNTLPVGVFITTDYGEQLNIGRNFIRGGNRVSGINQTTNKINQSLRVSESLPVWSNYPVFDYFLTDQITIQKIELSKIEKIDYKRQKGCNNIYVKFLNQNGGYSFWLFESFTKKETSTNLGYLFNSQSHNLVDLGNDSKTEIQLVSKIPKEYKNYAQDLIVSQDIFIYDNGFFEKIVTKSNAIDFDNVKKVYTVSINFDYKYRFNPSLL